MRIEYTFVVLGVVLAFVAAVVPYYSGAYQLLFGVFVVNLIPYLLYSPVAARLNRPETVVAGALLLGVHGTFVINERFVNAADYSGSVIFVVPLILAALVLPLFIAAARRPWQS